MRICVAATPEVALPTLDALLKSGHQIVSVITRPDAPAGRGRNLTASPVSDWAVTNKIRVYKPNNPQEIASLVSECDLVLTIGFGVILPAEILTIPEFGFLNLHFSLLPRWRGAAPVQRAIEAGDEITGVTVFKLDAGMDTGPIYYAVEHEIKPDINSKDLLQELADLGVKAVFKAFDLIEAGQVPKPQVNEGATIAKKLNSEEAQIDWSQNSKAITNKVRAFNPNPGAWSNFRGEKVKIDEAKSNGARIEPGVLIYQEKKVLVGSGDCSVELVKVKPAGKNSMSAQSWINGLHLATNERFDG